MLQNPEFDSKGIDPDLHQRMAKAVDDGRIKCFNLLEGAADGDQDLNFWISVDLVRWKMFVGRLWKIPSSKAIKTSILKWTLTS